MINRTINHIDMDVSVWAALRGLHNADPAKQALKLGEEYGELCADLAKGRDPKDSIGDILVVISILCRQLGTDMQTCFDLAYNEIANRKGTLINGIFVKEGDM